MRVPSHSGFHGIWLSLAGIMENIFDGIQRPLEAIYESAGKSPFVPLGVDVPALNRFDSSPHVVFFGSGLPWSHASLFFVSCRTKGWGFKPLNFSEGQTIVGGSIFGEVYENELMKSHKIMLPPDLYGTVVRVYGTGTDGKDMYTLEDTVCATVFGTVVYVFSVDVVVAPALQVLEIEHGDTGEVIPIGMSHFWCVRLAFVFAVCFVVFFTPRVCLFVVPLAGLCVSHALSLRSCLVRQR